MKIRFVYQVFSQWFFVSLDGVAYRAASHGDALAGRATFSS
jgi:hypothetical protein